MFDVWSGRESTEILYDGKTYKTTVWGHFVPSLSINNVDEETALELVKVFEAMARKSGTLEGMKRYAEYALAIKDGLKTSYVRCEEAEAEAKVRAAECKAQEEAEAQEAQEAAQEAQEATEA